MFRIGAAAEATFFHLGGGAQWVNMWPDLQFLLDTFNVLEFSWYHQFYILKKSKQFPFFFVNPNL